jgi:hypothetical protein
MSPRRRCALLPPAALLILAALVLPAGFAAAQQPAREASISLADYRALLAAAAERIKAGSPPAELERLREATPASWRVEAPPDEHPVSAEWLRRALASLAAEESAAGRQRLAARLRAMEAEAAALEAAAPVAPGDARARLDEVLARREFRRVNAPTWWQKFMERVYRLFMRVLEWIFGPISRALGRPSLTMELLIWIAIGVLFVVLTLLLVRSLQRARRNEKLVAEAGAETGRDWRGWLSAARAAAAREDWRAALHAAYWAAVWRLAEAGTWRVEDSRTPREYLRLLSQHSSAREPLTALTRRFELAWYGYRTATPDDFAAAAAELERLGCPLESQPAI